LEQFRPDARGFDDEPQARDVGLDRNAAVSGADPVGARPGFAEMLERLMSNGARTISPDRPTSKSLSD